MFLVAVRLCCWQQSSEFQRNIRNALQELLSLDEKCQSACACVERALSRVHAANVATSKKAASKRDRPGLPDLVLLKYYLERSSKHRKCTAVLSMLPSKCSSQVHFPTQVMHAALASNETGCNRARRAGTPPQIQEKLALKNLFRCLNPLKLSCTANEAQHCQPGAADPDLLHMSIPRSRGIDSQEACSAAYPLPTRVSSYHPHSCRIYPACMLRMRARTTVSKHRTRSPHACATHPPTTQHRSAFPRSRACHAAPRSHP